MSLGHCVLRRFHDCTPATVKQPAHVLFRLPTINANGEAPQIEEAVYVVLGSENYRT